MKKLVFATLMMCVTAMSANAQVLTSETVKNVYKTVSDQPNEDFLYNAEWTGDDLTTLYVYKNSSAPNGTATLKPHVKYTYSYAADGMLTSRTTYRWNNSKNSWTCAARLDYTLDSGKYSAEYSRYNPIANSFDKPLDKMVYSLMPDVDVNYVCCYHRNRPSNDYQLVSETFVQGPASLIAAK